jgi:hypothetical protein
MMNYTPLPQPLRPRCQAKLPIIALHVHIDRVLLEEVVLYTHRQSLFGLLRNGEARSVKWTHQTQQRVKQRNTMLQQRQKSLTMLLNLLPCVQESQL